MFEAVDGYHCSVFVYEMDDESTLEGNESMRHVEMKIGSSRDYTTELF